jgi:hypothetical protein
MRFPVQHRADEHDLADGAVGEAMRRDRHRLAFAHQRKVGGAHREVDPDAIEIGNGEELRLEIVAPDRRAEIDLALDHASGHWCPDLLPAQGDLRLLGQRRDLSVREADREQLLAGDVEAHPGLGRGGARTQQQLLAGDAAIPQILVAIVEVLGELAGQAGGEIFALRARDLAAFQHRHHLVLGDAVAELLAQLGDRGGELDRRLSVRGCSPVAALIQ